MTHVRLDDDHVGMAGEIANRGVDRRRPVKRNESLHVVGREMAEAPFPAAGVEGYLPSELWQIDIREVASPEGLILGLDGIERGPLVAEACERLRGVVVGNLRR